MIQETNAEIAHSLRRQFEEPNGPEERSLLSSLTAVTIEVHRTPIPVGAAEELRHRQLTRREHELRTALQEAQLARRTTVGEERLRTIRQGPQAIFAAVAALTEQYTHDLLLSRSPRTSHGIEILHQMASHLAVKEYSLAKTDRDEAQAKVEGLQAEYWHVEAGGAP